MSLKARFAVATSVVAIALSMFAKAAFATAAGYSAVVRVFGHNRTAHCVASHESHYTPWEVSPTDDWGLFQINRPSWFGKVVSYGRYRIRISQAYIKNPLYNARVAWIISRGGRDFTPWTTYRRYCS